MGTAVSRGPNGTEAAPVCRTTPATKRSPRRSRNWASHLVSLHCAIQRWASGPWRDLLRGLRTHADPAVRETALTTFTTAERHHDDSL